jgi:hypothetical protein
MNSPRRAGPDPQQCGFDIAPPVKPVANGNCAVPIPGITKLSWRLLQGKRVFNLRDPVRQIL